MSDDGLDDGMTKPAMMQCRKRCASNSTITVVPYVQGDPSCIESYIRVRPMESSHVVERDAHGNDKGDEKRLCKRAALLGVRLINFVRKCNFAVTYINMRTRWPKEQCQVSTFTKQTNGVLEEVDQ